MGADFHSPKGGLTGEIEIFNFAGMDQQSSLQEKSLSKSETTMPAPGQPVMVRCRTFRCMAYRDRDGKWRGAFRHEELPEILEILSPECFRQAPSGAQVRVGQGGSRR